MKKIGYMLLCFMIMTSCATLVPSASKYKINVPKDDISYQFDMQSVDSSKITSQEKLVAKNLLFEFHSFRSSFQKFVSANDSIYTKNDNLNNKYSTTNGIVGGLGGLTAIGTVFASWTVIVPIATGVWNLVGLGIQKLNVVPQLEQGKSNKDQINSLNDKFSHTRELFYLFVTSQNPSDAETNYKLWYNELNRALDQSATIFGSPRVSMIQMQ